MPEMLTLIIDDASTSVPAGITVAAAIALASLRRAAGPAGHAPATTRRSVTGQMRAPLCGMGVCQECRVTVDGRAHVLACQTLCRSGMVVETGTP